MNIFSSPKVDYSRWGVPTRYQNLEHFQSSFRGQSGLTVIEGNRFPIDLFFKNRGESTLYVFFNAARKDRLAPMPYFTWMSLSDRLSGNALFISDSTLYYSETLNLGWYIGGADFPLQKILLDVIKHVANITCAKRVICCGSSGGGFPAILYSQLIDNAVAVVNAPATTLINHHNPQNVSVVLQEAFGIPPHESAAVLKSINVEADLYSFISERGPRNIICILQNSRDRFYINNHLNPLVRVNEEMRMERTDKKIKVIYCRWGNGHVVPPGPVLEHYLQSASTWKDNSDVDVSVANSPIYIQEVAFNKAEDGGYWSAATSDDDCEIAYYLYKDNERISTSWYKKNNTFRHDPAYGSGLFHVIAFARRANGSSVHRLRSTSVRIAN